MPIERHYSHTSACLATISEHAICDTLISLPLDMSPAAFRCAACRSVYVVDPIKRGEVGAYGAPKMTYEMDGRKIELFDSKQIRDTSWDDWAFQSFLMAKVGSLKRAMDLVSLSAQGKASELMRLPENKVLAEAHYRLGKACLSQRDGDGALREIQEALNLDPEHAQAHFQLGQYYRSRNRWTDAIREIEKAVQYEPNNDELKSYLLRLRNHVMGSA